MSDNNLFFNSEEIRDLPLRTEFVTGPAGPTGNQGEAGAGITIGGITGQVLAKRSNANYDTEWVNQTAFPSVTWGSITGTLANQADLQSVLNAKAPSTGILPSAISGTAVITTDARLSDSRPPNGSATGDLGGTYPAPSVAKLQGYSVSATSPSIGQILQWGGASWLPAAIPQGGSGGGGVNYFFNFNEAAVAPITGLPTSPQSAARLSRFATITQSAITSAHLSQVAYDLVAGFVSDPADPNVTQIPAGLWDFNIWADSNANRSNECILRIFVYKYNGTTTTLLSESDDIYLYDPTVINQYSASVVFPFTTILATDRIYIELRGKATKNNIHISLHFGNVTPSHAHTTFSSVAGTGVVKVVNGVFQTPANLIFDADVDAVAAIAQSKIANLTTDLAGKLGLATGSCIIAKSGDNLLAKYAEAKLLTPNGAAISQQNRATLIILSGTYSLPATWEIDTDGVDVIALGATSFYPSVFIEINSGDQISVSCNYIRIVGIGVEENLLITSSNGDNCIGVVFEKCFASIGNSFNAPVGQNISADFIDCQAGGNSFGSQNGLTGNFVNCKGDIQCFSFGGNASGTFTNCQGGDYSFGGGDANYYGTAQGTFVNCTAGINSFGGGDDGINLGGVSTGVFTNCTGGTQSFGQSQNGSKRGKYFNCVGINEGTLSAPTSGFAIQLNCTDLNGNIVEGFKP
jgi:hypothetical protein